MLLIIILNIYEKTTDNKNNIIKKIIFKLLFKTETWLLNKGDLNSTISFSMVDKLNKKSKFEGTTDLFGSVNEVGEISFSEGKAVFIKSIDPALTEEAFARYVSEKGSFREIRLSTFSEPALFEETFSPFIDGIRPILVFQLDNFFVFTESEKIGIGNFESVLGSILGTTEP